MHTSTQKEYASLAREYKKNLSDKAYKIDVIDKFSNSKLSTKCKCTECE